MRQSFPLVSIISVNYNTLKDTLEFLASARQLTWPALEIIVVDNASRENPESSILNLFPEVRMIVSPVNLGFAGGNNLGIKQATGDYFLFLNNDTLLLPDFVETMVDFMESHPKAGMASPKVIYPDKKTIQYAGTTNISPFTGRGIRIGLFEEDKGQYDKNVQTGLPHGAALIVPRSVVNKIGPMPDFYFLYYEEHDWCEASKRMGYEMYYVGTTSVVHKESMSTGGDESPLKVYYLTRNRLLFMRRNFHGFSFFTGLAFFAFAAVPKSTLKYIVKGKIKLLKAFYSGILWNIKNMNLSTITGTGS